MRTTNIGKKKHSWPIWARLKKIKGIQEAKNGNNEYIAVVIISHCSILEQKPNNPVCQNMVHFRRTIITSDVTKFKLAVTAILVLVTHTDNVLQSALLKVNVEEWIPSPKPPTEMQNSIAELRREIQNHEKREILKKSRRRLLQLLEN